MVSVGNIRQDEWALFVKNHPKGCAFQTPMMYACYQATPGCEPYVIAAYEEDRIVGLMVWIVMREPGFKSRFSVRSIIQGGPLAENDRPDVIVCLLRAYEKKLDKDVIYTQIRNHYEMLTSNDAFQACGYRFQDHLNFLIPLDSEEQIWSRIGKGRIKQIKKAQKNDLKVQVYDSKAINNQLIADGYEVIRSVYKHAGLPLTDIEQVKAVNRQGLLRMFIVYSPEGKLIGCRFGIVYKDSIYGWYAGSYRDYYNLYPNDILIWETLRWGCKNGYKIFDYGGAGEPNKPYGVRSFKQQMGGQLVNFGRYEKIHRPIMYKIGILGMWCLKRISKAKN